MPWNRVFFPNGYDTDVEEWEEFGLEHRFPIVELWQQVKDEEDGGEGWNKKKVIDAIKMSVPEWDDLEPMDVERKMNEVVVDEEAMRLVVKAARASGLSYALAVELDRDEGEGGKGGMGSHELMVASELDKNNLAMHQMEMLESLATHFEEMRREKEEENDSNVD